MTQPSRAAPMALRMASGVPAATPQAPACDHEIVARGLCHRQSREPHRLREHEVAGGRSAIAERALTSAACSTASTMAKCEVEPTAPTRTLSALCRLYCPRARGRRWVRRWGRPLSVALSNVSYLPPMTRRRWSRRLVRRRGSPGRSSSTDVPGPQSPRCPSGSSPTSRLIAWRPRDGQFLRLRRSTNTVISAVSVSLMASAATVRSSSSSIVIRR